MIVWSSAVVVLPLTRSVEEPLWGSTVGSQIEVAGTAELKSGTVPYIIVDADGLMIHEGEIASTRGVRSEFTTSSTLGEIPNPSMGSIIVWEWAPDGSQQQVPEYPLTLANEP
ncbi:MAG: Gmad2 immunoglobulin-like domain-containing protein [Actinomycetota bacterium]